MILPNIWSMEYHNIDMFHVKTAALSSVGYLYKTWLVPMPIRPLPFVRVICMSVYIAIL